MAPLEAIPWATGKQHITTSFAWFLVLIAAAFGLGAAVTESGLGTVIARVLVGLVTVVQQACGTTKARVAGAKYLGEFIEDEDAPSPIEAADSSRVS